MTAVYHQPLDVVPFEELANWEYHAGDMPIGRVWDADSGWNAGGKTLIWDDDTRVVWFRSTWSVPEQWAGLVLVPEFNVRNGMQLYVDGLAAPSVLSSSAEPGREYCLALRGDRGRRPGMIMRSRIWAYPKGYERWVHLCSLPASLVPGRGMLIDEWRRQREVSGEPLAAPDLDDAGWPAARLGDQWKEPDSCYWYRTRVTVPEEILGYETAGLPLRLTAMFNQRGEIYVDGRKRGEHARDYGDVVVSESAQPGAEHVIAIRVPTTNSGWLRDTYLQPQPLTDALGAREELAGEIDAWRRFLNGRPEPRFVASACDAMGLLEDVTPGKAQTAPQLRAAWQALATLREQRADDAPFVALPYLQMPRPDGITVRAESPCDRPSILNLEHPGGTVSEHRTPHNSRFHRHVLDDLTPDTEYRYSIRAGDVSTGWRAFRTAPATFRPFSAVMWGDSHYGPEILESIARHAARLQSDLMLTAGDMVGDGYNEREFVEHLLHPLRYSESCAPIHFPVGNHDHGSWTQQGRLTNPYLDARFEPVGEGPGASPYGYSFDYAGCHFVFVDPYFGRKRSRSDGIRPGAPQHDWLAADLAGAAEARWKFVFVHEPPFCETWEGGYYNGEEEAREHLVPLMELHGVDLCVAGHAHTYERGIPHPPYDPDTGEGNTVAYLITGGGGSLLDNRKYYEWPQIDIPPHRVQETDDPLSNDRGEYYRYHFCEMKVEWNRLEVVAWWIRTDGTIVDVLDRFVLRKGIPRRG